MYTQTANMMSATKSLLIMILLLAFPLAAEAPWGKDASLARTVRHGDQPAPTESTLSTGAQGLIRFYQRFISPANGPRSHYRPTSSQYTLEAIARYGFFKGWLMGCDRLMRENGEMWVYRTLYTEQGEFLKSDPVR